MSFFNAFSFSPGIAYIKSRLIFVSPLSLIFFNFSSISLYSHSLSSMFKLLESKDSMPILTRFIPYSIISSKNSSSISLGFTSIVDSQSGSRLNISNVLSNLILSFLDKHDGVPPPMYKDFILSPS